MKTYLAMVVGVICFTATAQAQTLADFVGDWTYTGGVIEAYTPDGALVGRESIVGRTYTFKKQGKRIVTTPQNGGTTLTHKLEGDTIVLAPEKQKKCLNTEDGYCCSVHIVNTYTLINNQQLRAEVQYGFMCDGVVRNIAHIFGVLTKD